MIVYVTVSLVLVGLALTLWSIPPYRTLFGASFSVWITVLDLFGLRSIARQAMDHCPPQVSSEYASGFRDGAVAAQERLRLYHASLLIAAWTATAFSVRASIAERARKTANAPLKCNQA